MSSPVQLPQELLAAVEEALPRSKRRATAALARDLAGAWWGLRTAVLVDSCMLSESDAAALGSQLAKASIDALFVLHEPVSGQTLVVNRELLKARLDKPDVAIVDVGGRVPVVLPSPPPSLSALLDSLSSSVAASSASYITLVLPDPSRPQDLVPLVGLLLDYPVAYSLGASEGPNCVGGRELVVVEAALFGPRGTRERLLSFSYPCGLPSGPEGSLLVERLHLTLSTRLAAAQAVHPELEGAQIEVEERMVVLDQVAL
ncbi:hypothetical protein DMC30DRAFT_244463 [Rhodotorula diobovata]|uniref:Uncharacterized protein n=1 Tax=Rhodotorula diobovata TaxID=5288 RepID=A0A5C5FWG9_9BASI|nr:hypothetical protein DMC30DRAFT_244463 [Rhodotorula diobovata]